MNVVVNRFTSMASYNGMVNNLTCVASVMCETVLYIHEYALCMCIDVVYASACVVIDSACICSDSVRIISSLVLYHFCIKETITQHIHLYIMPFVLLLAVHITLQCS